MSAVQTLQDAIYGNPPSPGFKPSREGVLKAFIELQTTASLAGGGLASYSTLEDLNAVTPDEGDARVAFVVADPVEENNNIYKFIGSLPWVVFDEFYNGLLRAIQPIIDRANLAIDAADKLRASRVVGDRTAAGSSTSPTNITFASERVPFDGKMDQTGISVTAGGTGRLYSVDASGKIIESRVITVDAGSHDYLYSPELNVVRNGYIGFLPVTCGPVTFSGGGVRFIYDAAPSASPQPGDQLNIQVDNATQIVPGLSYRVRTSIFDATKTLALFGSLANISATTYGDHTTGSIAGNKAIFIGSSDVVAENGVIDLIGLNMQVGGDVRVISTDSAGKVIDRTSIFATAGPKLYTIEPIAAQRGGFVLFVATGGKALFYSATGGDRFVYVNNPSFDADVGDQLNVTIDENSTIRPGISYRLRVAQSVANRPVTYVIVGYGQSLSIGTTPGVNTAITTPHRDGQVRMFNGGVRIVTSGANYGTDAAVNPADIDRLVVAKGQTNGGTLYGETNLESLAYKLAADLGWKVVIFTAGVGGIPWPQLAPGSTPWANLTAGVQQAQRLLEAEGEQVVFIGNLRHGESQQNDTRVTYAGDLTNIVTEMSALFKSVSGQTVAPFFMSQPPALLARSEVPFAILDVADARDDFFVVGGFYGLPFVDQHLTSSGYFYDGDITGEYVREWWNGGGRDGTPQPLRIESVTYNANVPEIVVQFGGFKSDIAVSINSDVPAIANYGLELFSDAGTQPTLGNPSNPNPGSGAIHFSLSGPWNGANKRVKSAYTKPTTGAFGDPSFYCRTNLRDNIAIGSRLDGSALYRRLIACDVAVS